MAGSYFSRMLRRSATPLVPPRPISNLWKSSRLGRTEAESAPEVPSLVTSRAPRITATESEPAVATAPAVSSSPGEGTPAAHRVTNHELTPVARPAAARERIREAAKASSRELEPQREPSAQLAPAVKPEAPQLAADSWQPSRSAAVLLPEPVPEMRPAREPLPPQQRSERPVAGAPMTSSEPAAALARAMIAAAAAKREASASRPPAAPSRLGEPIQPREPAPRSSSTQEHTRAESRNSVQIGKIEVQVVAPAGPVRYAPAPAAPKGRLARGYSLWAAWQ
jgi:hypothetical protein